MVGDKEGMADSKVTTCVTLHQSPPSPPLSLENLLQPSYKWLPLPTRLSPHHDNRAFFKYKLHHVPRWLKFL